MRAMSSISTQHSIEMVKASLVDPAVELWARETSDVARFATELRLYDDHLARYPKKAYVPKGATVTSIYVFLMSLPLLILSL